MKIAIRVDGSTALGNGHLSRCLTLAKALRLAGGDCVFILQPLPGVLSKMILSADFSAAFLPDATLTQEQDALASQKIAEDYFLGTPRSEIFWILDVYSLDVAWHTVIKNSHAGLLIIDDLANKYYCADFILDQTPLRKKNAYESKINAQCQLLLGAEYLLLREDFIRLHESVIMTRDRGILSTSPRVFIALGGTDANDFSSTIIRKLMLLAQSNTYLFTLVIASNAPHLESLRKLAAQYSNLHVHVDVKNMAELLVEQDIAIGAAGVSALERASLGLPSMNFVIADNQQIIAENLAQLGCAINLGACNDLGIQNMVNKFLWLTQSPQAWENMSAAGFALCDGRGIERVTTHLQHWHIKRAMPEEA